MARHYSVGRLLRFLEGVDVMSNILWICPKCKTVQDPDEVRIIEILEPGRAGRVEYHGKIRPSYRTAIVNYLPKSGTPSWIEFSCLVCGNVWDTPIGPEDPTPGGSAITFLHPITECDDECSGQCSDRDAC
jgi:rubredoxin